VSQLVTNLLLVRQGGFMTDTTSHDRPRRAVETDDYSASQAPETRQEAEERTSYSDTRLIPGGARGADAEIGLTSLSEKDVPSKAHKPAQLDVRDAPDDERA
jgi:hypothetical protein